MSAAGRNLQVGDEAVTDFNGSTTRVRITSRSDSHRSQTGITFQVESLLKNCDRYSWLDSAWFEPAPPK